MRIDEILSHIPGISEYDYRVAEIVAAWDEWQAAREAAKHREGVEEANKLHQDAVENYPGIAWHSARRRQWRA